MSDWADGAGGATQAQDAGAWVLSKLGYAIDVYVDRTLRRPAEVVDPSVQFGMDAYGNVYQAGKLDTRSASSAGISPLLLLAGVAVVVLMLNKA
jgi:hypothetical protein